MKEIPVYMEETCVSDVVFNHISEILERERSFILGQVLTIVDASISDPQQRKAMKDLMSRVFYTGNRGISNYDYLLYSLGKFLVSLDPKQVMEETSTEKYSDELFKKFKTVKLG